jgi:hypothetical protein
MAGFILTACFGLAVAGLTYVAGGFLWDLVRCLRGGHEADATAADREGR